MGRRGSYEALYVAVPTHFRCPISLDVMKSPVSLCTGVTYDRSSIQHWLDSGHDTCPATMQLLSSKDLVPNLTLHRLISLWSSAASPRPLPPVSGLHVGSLIEKIQREPDVRSLEEVADVAEGNSSGLVKHRGFVEAVAGVLGRERLEIRVLELVFRILDRVLVENGVKEEINGLLLLHGDTCLRPFISVLRNGAPKSQAETVRVLDSVFSLNSESKRFVAECHDLLLPVLIGLIETEGGDLNDVVFSFLISVSVTRSIKARLVHLGLVGVLSKIIGDKNAAASDVEKSLRLLAVTSTCAEGRAAISEHVGCVGSVVGRLMKVPKTATEDGIVVLWSLCCAFKDGRVQEKAVRGDGMVKVLLVMQSVGEGCVRKMCGDLVKVLRILGCKENLGCYETKTTHIMPC